MSGKLTLEHDFGPCVNNVESVAWENPAQIFLFFNFIGPFMGSFLFFVVFY